MGKYDPRNSFESLMLSNMMHRLQIRPPYLDTNCFVSNAGDRIGGDAEEESELAKEEAELERKIVDIISSGKWDSLKPNSGQAVTVGDHHICVGFHEEEGSGFRIWEWHGHIMLYDQEKGYTAEYVYGNYFERVHFKVREVAEKEAPHGTVGLGELIDDTDVINGLILCRNMSASFMK